MPIDRYLVVKKAAELEEIDCRLQFIFDLQAAFFGNKKHVETLNKTRMKILGPDIKWKADPNWKEKLSKYVR